MINIFINILSFFLVGILFVGFGLFVTSKTLKHLTVLERWIVVTTTGIVSWALLIYGFSWIHLRWLSLVLVIVGSLLGWWKSKYHLLSGEFKVNWVLVIILLIGILGQLFLVFPSGLVFEDGMRFYGVNSHDGMWHVTLMEILQKPFPVELPTYAGTELRGYHFLVDLWGSELARVFAIRPVDLTFRWLPGLFSLLSGLSMFALLRRITKTQLAAYFGVFLTYFAGSLGYALSLMGNQNHSWETAFWAQQSITTFINLPLGASFAILPVIILLIIIYFDSKKDIKLLWITSLLVGSMISIKAYGGVLSVAAFVSVLLLYSFISKKIAIGGPTLLSLAIAGLLLISQLQPGNGSFLWQPGWFLKTMMETPDRVNYPIWELQRQTYVFENNLPRLIQYWLVAFAIFFIGNMGIRILGFVSVVRDALSFRKRIPYVSLFMLVVVILGTLIPLLLLQKGVVWNSIQFIYYALFIMNIFSARFIDSISRNKLRIMIVALLILLTLPTTIHTLSVYYKNYMKTDSYLLISHDELEALSFIKQLPAETKLLTDYNDTSYVSALSGKTVFYADETQASILLLPLDRRDQVIRVFCHDAKAGEVKAFMETYDLTHVFVTKSDNANCVGDFDNNEFVDRVFVNTESAVYQFN